MNEGVWDLEYYSQIDYSLQFSVFLKRCLQKNYFASFRCICFSNMQSIFTEISFNVCIVVFCLHRLLSTEAASWPKIRIQKWIIQDLFIN